MSNEFVYLLPLWSVIFGAILVLFIEMIFHEKGRDVIPYVSIVFILIALFGTIRNYIDFLATKDSVLLFQNTAKIDILTNLFIIGALLSGLLAILYSVQYLTEHRAITGEYYALILLVVSGMINLIVSNDLITFFVGLELMSIGSYVLAGYFRVREKSIEAAMKYYLPGVFSTAIILMGIAFIYGNSGTTYFNTIKAVLPLKITTLYSFYFGVLLLLVGLGFKIALVPFHAYAPDVYDGSSAPISAFLSTGVKVAAFAILIRFMGEVFSISGDWLNIIPILSILTMFVGNIMAFNQDSIKRMLAYSSVAHAGYILLAIVTIDKAPLSEVYFSVAFYLIAYTFMTAGAFGLLGWLSRKEEKLVNYDDLSGIAKKHPWFAGFMAVFMFSLAGFPPTAGFFGKYYVFRLAIVEGYYGLAILGILNSFMSAYYYLKVIIYMFMKKEQDFELPEPFVALRFGILISVLGTLIIGFVPFYY